MYQIEPRFKDLYKIVILRINKYWKAVAYALQFSTARVQAIEATHHGDSMECCLELFKKWLHTDEGVEPKTWSTLLAKLEQVEPLKPVVEEIKSIIL